MQFTWVLPLALSLASVSAMPLEASPMEARDADGLTIFARAVDACVPLCAGAVNIGAAACGSCGQQKPCAHYACSNGNRQVCGKNQGACYYSN